MNSIHMTIGHFLVTFDVFHIESHSTDGAFQTSFMPELEKKTSEYSKAWSEREEQRMEIMLVGGVRKNKEPDQVAITLMLQIELREEKECARKKT